MRPNAHRTVIMIAHDQVGDAQKDMIRALTGTDRPGVYEIHYLRDAIAQIRRAAVTLQEAISLIEAGEEGGAA